MNKDIKEIMIDETEINSIVDSMAENINGDYVSGEIVAIVILKGSLVFASDLIRRLKLDVKIDFIQASSYGSGSVSSGKLKIKKDIETDIRGKRVLIIEDIIDSGRTLSILRRELESRGAADVRIAALLTKPARREVEVNAEYVGAEIADEFVVGYGLDYDERYRHLRYIGILKPEVYS